MNPTHVCLLIAVCTLSLMMLGGPAHADELYVKPGVAPGGSGTSIDDPVPTIQVAIDGFEGTRGYVFLYPGVYQEDVEVSSGSFWFRPIDRYGGVTIEGTFTIRTAGIIIRGFDFRSEGSAITLADGAARSLLSETRSPSITA